MGEKKCPECGEKLHRFCLEKVNEETDEGHHIPNSCKLICFKCGYEEHSPDREYDNF